MIANAVSISWRASDFATGSSEPATDQDTNLSTGSKAGIGAGVAFVVLMCLMFGLFFFFFRQQKTRGQVEKEEPLQQINDDGDKGDQQTETNQKPAESSISLWAKVGLDTWFYEIVGLSFAIVCFAATVCILRVYQDQLSPHLPYKITLNTIIYILATGSKSSLLFVIGECMGLLKWISFQKAMPLLYL